MKTLALARIPKIMPQQAYARYIGFAAELALELVN